MFIGHMLTTLFHPLVGIPTEKKIREIKSANSPKMSLAHKATAKLVWSIEKLPSP